MLMIGLGSTGLDAREKRWLASPGVAGVLLFSRNYESPDQLGALCESIRATGGEHLLIAVDQEGGPVQRFRHGFTALPPLLALGEAYDADPVEAVRLAEEHAWVMASELRASGVDFSFAPVVDLARGNAAIGTRAFHRDPAVTAELAEAYVRGLHLAGMAAVLKHFPGHGSVATDTHKAQAIDPRSLEDIQAADLLPFVECIEAHAEAVMMAHVTYPAVDDQPAGYSRAWIGQVLRHDLGFGGAVISDDISMAAAGTAGSVGERVTAHLAAGCDLVLACFPEVVEEALAAVERSSGPLPPSLSALRGAVGATWRELTDNPQRDRFVARITALNAEKGAA